MSEDHISGGMYFRTKLPEGKWRRTGPGEAPEMQPSAIIDEAFATLTWIGRPVPAKEITTAMTDRVRTEFYRARGGVIDIADRARGGVIDLKCERDAMAKDLNRVGALLNEATAELARVANLRLGEYESALERFAAKDEEIADLKRRLALQDEPGSHDYHGPVDDGRAIPDTVHERFHGAVGDVMAGRVMPEARRQMQEALKNAPKEPKAAPRAILTGNKAPMGMVWSH